jgi:branched-chain amino acid transport system ATP-binding protein
MTTVLETDGLTVQYGGVKAVSEVRVIVPEGKLVGLIGPNGAGKTTFIDAVSGFVEPTTGRTIFLGDDVTNVSAARRSRQGLRRSFQSLELFEDMTALENVRVPISHHPWHRVWFGRGAAHGKSSIEMALEALEAAGAAPLAQRLPSEMSHGQRRLVSVARAVAGGARLLLMDEPAAGLDSAESSALGRRLQRLVTKDTAMLLVDHDTDLVFSICDYIYVMDFGKVIAHGTPAAVRADPLVRAAYLGDLVVAESPSDVAGATA